MAKLKYLIFGLVFTFFLTPNVKAQEFYAEDCYYDLFVTRMNRKNDASSNMCKYTSRETNVVFSTEPYKSYPNYDYYERSTDIGQIDEFDRIMAYQGLNLALMHDNDNYIKAAQHLIWSNHLEDGNYELSVHDFTSEERMLLGMVDLYTKSPSFTNLEYYFTNDEIVVKDKNNILKYFDIVDIDGNSITYTKNNNNELIIKPQRFGTTILYLRRYMTGKSYEMEMFYNDNYTNFISAGNFYIDRKVTITIIPSYTVINIPSSLSSIDVSYGIYKNNNLVYRLDVNKPGKYQIDGLDVGTYTLKQIPKNSMYTYDETVYDIEIQNEPTSYVLNTVEEIVGKLTINNINLNTDYYLYDSSNNLVSEFSYLEKEASIIIPYGNYRIVYGLDENLDIEINKRETTIDLIQTIEEELEEFDDLKETSNGASKEPQDDLDENNEEINNSDNTIQEEAEELSNVIEPEDNDNMVSIEAPDTLKISLFLILGVILFVKKITKL